MKHKHTEFRLILLLLLLRVTVNFNLTQNIKIINLQTIDDDISYNFATQTAAVLRTYGSSSFKHLRNGSHKYSVILSTRIQPIVRTANARIKGFESSQSFLVEYLFDI